jgi:2-keto-4-pentenoate hydratase
MTIGPNGISPEQVRLSPNNLTYPAELLKVGEQAWIQDEAIWADPKGAVFVDITYPLFDRKPRFEEDEEYVILFKANPGYVVVASHLSGYKVGVEATAEAKDRKRMSQPVVGLAFDAMMVAELNAIIALEYGEEAVINLEV